MRNDFESNYLMHWGLKKGAKAPNHKYYERVEKNGKYLYFYTQAEYEAWLHQGNSTLETAKEKGKGLLDKAKDKLGSLAKDSNSKQTLANTKQNLVNAVNTGYGQAANLLAMAQKQLTKSNAQQVIDRGNKAISSILNTTSNVASNVSKQAQNSLKATSANVQNRAKSIASKVERTIKQAGKDTSKVVNSYISKGEKAIKQTLSKASNMTVNQASKTYSGAGTAIVTALAVYALAKVAIAVGRVAAYVVREKNDEKKRQEAEQKKREELAKHKTDEEKKAIEDRRSQFSKDADDSYKEDPDKGSYLIHEKEKATSKDEDMMAINPEGIKAAKELEQLEKEADEYYQLFVETNDPQYRDKYWEVYDKYAEKYNEYYGYLNNCANCSLAYDLRRRGYDVDAPWNEEGTSDITVADWYKLDPNKDIDWWDSGRYDRNNQPFYPFDQEHSDAIINDIKEKYPEGSYGHMMLVWEYGQGGHDCVWSVENGEVIIRECQTGQIVDPDEYLSKSCQAAYFRADDKELTDKAYKLAESNITNAYGQDVSDSKIYQYKKNKKEKNKRKEDKS